MHIRNIINLPNFNQKIIRFAEQMGKYGLKDTELKRFMPFEID